MTKYGLRTWMILLTLAPTLLVGLLLGSYFTVSRFLQQEDALVSKGINLIEPLSILAEYALVDNNREQLMRLIDISHRKYSQDVRSISVFSADSEVFVSSNFHHHFDALRLPKGQRLPKHTQVEYRDDSILLRSPIFPDLSRYQGLTLEPIGYMVIQLDLTGLSLLRHKTTFHTLLILLIGVVTCVFFTIRLVHMVNRPILNMVEAIDEIRRGKLNTQLSGTHIGELDELKNGINAMAKSIYEHQSELHENIEQATEELRETLEQIEIQNVEMDIAKRRAQEAARIKSEFLANMSHELRTPLNGVLGFSRQLLKTQLNGPQRDQVETIESSAKNLLGIINDILDLSKLEAGKLTLDESPFVLRESVDEVLLLLAPEAYRKSLDVGVYIDAKVPDDLLGDEGRVKQVLTNLLSNAIKFTHEGSVQVRLKLEEAEHRQARISLEVQDTGVGISEQQQQQLFQAFSQADASISRRFGGTGLGLVITRRLLQQMGGDIRLESKSGVGSTFSCTFNCRISPITLSDNTQPDEIIGHSALIYEPQQFALQSLEMYMHNWLMQLTPCRTQEQWKAKSSEPHHYDVVLMDIDRMDGPLLKTELSRLEKITSHLIFMTAFVNRHNLEQFRHYKQMHISYLRKPVACTRLLKALKKARPALPEPLPAAVSTADQQRLPLQVLAVDDNPANLKLIETILKEKVSQVAIASSGEEAICLAQNHSYDLIFMDIQMPNIDGIMATERIRAQSLNQATPVVAVTAHALPEEKASLLASGMDDYLTKPIDEELLDLILKHWSSYQAPKPLPPLFSHPLVEWQQALAQAGGREELAKEMLNLLIHSLPSALQAIEEAWQSADIAELKAQVHKLHGACCYAGIPKLKNAANQLESLLKKGEQLEAVEPEYLELCDFLAQLIPLTTANRPS